VIDGAHFFVQIQNDQTAGLDELVATLTNLSVNEGPGQPPFTPRVGELVRAQFTEDDSWYRAKILSVGANLYSVLYIDYGNSETLPGNRIRPLPFAYQSLLAQSQEAGLAFVKAPKLESDWGRESQGHLRELAVGKKLMASVEYRDEGKMHLTLGDAESGVHINASLIRAGLARVDRRKKRFLSLPAVTKLREEEDKARSMHVGIWQYGDAPDSDDEEDEPRMAKAKPPQKDGKAPEKTQPRK